LVSDALLDKLPSAIDILIAEIRGGVLDAKLAQTNRVG
jgi:hypothetical protein